MVVSLTKSNGLIVNSLSIIDGKKLINIKDGLMNWLSGDSTGKNTISTGEGLLTIATPNDNGSFNNSIIVWGSGNPTKEGHVNFVNKVSMFDNLDVSGVITGGGLNVLTTGTGYTQTEINAKFSALNSRSGRFSDSRNTKRKPNNTKGGQGISL
jgi:hypothetical protein